MGSSTQASSPTKAAAENKDPPSTEAEAETSILPSVFFWREYDEPYGFLSQWYDSPFMAPSLSSATITATSSSSSSSPKNPPGKNKTLTFNTTEQYMMYRKAILFSDFKIAGQIMREPEPKKQRALGRKVKGFDCKVWDREKSGIVEDGNWWKFTGCKGGGLGEFLLETGERELVEASPHDRIWGVGYVAANAEDNRDDWGENLLGKALMRVRERLRQWEGQKGKII